MDPIEADRHTVNMLSSIPTASALNALSVTIAWYR